MARAWKIPWERYRPCRVCRVPAGKHCKTLVRGGKPSKAQRLKARPHFGRTISDPNGPRGRPGDPALRADRLIVWKRLAPRGVRVADIAHQLGMKPTALRQLVYRARLDGHPDAVPHLYTALPTLPTLPGYRRNRRQ